MTQANRQRRRRLVSMQLPHDEQQPRKRIPERLTPNYGRGRLPSPRGRVGRACAPRSWRAEPRPLHAAIVAAAPLKAATATATPPCQAVYSTSMVPGVFLQGCRAVPLLGRSRVINFQITARPDTEGGGFGPNPSYSTCYGPKPIPLRGDFFHHFRVFGELPKLHLYL